MPSARPTRDFPVLYRGVVSVNVSAVLKPRRRTGTGVGERHCGVAQWGTDSSTQIRCGTGIPVEVPRTSTTVDRQTHLWTAGTVDIQVRGDPVRLVDGVTTIQEGDLRTHCNVSCTDTVGLDDHVVTVCCDFNVTRTHHKLGTRATL
ncbi:hypothetical protein D3C75_1017120 [compost metagenome]